MSPADLENTVSGASKQDDAPPKGGVDLGSIEGFFRQHPDFPMPFVILAVATYFLTSMPPVDAWLTGMEPWGILSAAKLAGFSIMSSFAVHGFLTAQNDRLVRLDLKFQKDRAYDFQCGDACVRSSLIYLSQLVYAVMPVRSAPATWLEFFIGVSILQIVGDAWFFMVHSLFHSKALYKRFHKMHHKWDQPTAFAAYYITSYTHMIQEHLCVIPLMLFAPIPLSSFLFYEYIGTPGAQLQHCGYNLSELRIPFCGPLKLGHLQTLCSPWSLVLGPQTAAEHDYHHETFQGNFALSYSYLDKLFGTYVDVTQRQGYVRI